MLIASAAGEPAKIVRGLVEQLKTPDSRLMRGKWTRNTKNLDAPPFAAATVEQEELGEDVSAARREREGERSAVDQAADSRESERDRFRAQSASARARESASARESESARESTTARECAREKCFHSLPSVITWRVCGPPQQLRAEIFSARPEILVLDAHVREEEQVLRDAAAAPENASFRDLLQREAQLSILAAEQQLRTEINEIAEILGTQFTCFAGTKVQILTPEVLRPDAEISDAVLQEEQSLHGTPSLLALLVQKYKY
jgi:hypothetical protein